MKLIVHGTHHKCGTFWFHRIFNKSICPAFGWKYQMCTQKQLDPDTNVWIEDHSRIDTSQLKTPYVGSHIIRDPRDVLVSSYFYHLWCQEPWCLKPQPYLNGDSYQNVLNSLNQEDGIAFEMQNASSHNINTMLMWKYNDPNILEIKYEDLVANELDTFRKLFTHYGFNEEQIEVALPMTQKYTFEVWTKGRKLGQERRKNSHLRIGTPNDWKNHLSPIHIKRFKELFPNAVEQLGYSWESVPSLLLL